MKSNRSALPQIQPVKPAPRPSPAAPGRRPPGRPTPLRPRRPPNWFTPAKPPPKPPGGPLFKPPKIPRVPFGKRLPSVIRHLPPSVLKRLFPFLIRGLPFVGMALTAWEIYDWMQNPNIKPDATNLTPYGGNLCCKDPNIFPLDSYAQATQTSDNCGGASTLCGLAGQPRTGGGDWPPRLLEYSSTGTARRILYIGKANLGATRQTHGEIWVFPRGTVLKVPAAVPFIPQFPGVQLPDWLAPPVPFAPQPIPWSPPLTWPDPLPSPEAPPVPAPVPYSPPVVASPPGVPVVPSVDFSPGGSPEPSFHVPRPPHRDDEREKKKRLGPSASYKWYKFLEKAGGTYMEFDDNVAALYKGLHWSVRRWRGRDGVWRDRDITSVARMERIFAYAATVKFSVSDAILELSKEQASDWAFGKIGNAIKKKTTENANAGWWAGARGPSSSPQDKFLPDMYKELQRQRFQRNKELHKYTSWREAENGKWVRVERYRPNTQIPWYKQDSLYPAPLKLRKNRVTGGWKRNYYASSATQRPRTIRGSR